MDLTRMLMLRARRAAAESRAVTARIAEPAPRTEPEPEPEPEPIPIDREPEGEVPDSGIEVRERDGVAAASPPTAAELIDWAAGVYQAPGTPDQRALSLLGGLDRWLDERLDRPDPAEFLQRRREPAEGYPADANPAAGAEPEQPVAWAADRPDGDPPEGAPPEGEIGPGGPRQGGPQLDPESALSSVRDLLAAALVETMSTDAPVFAAAARLTRLLLVVDVADPAVLGDDEVRDDARTGDVSRSGSALVWDRLHRRFVLLPPSVGAPRAKVQLVREATVGDLAVVRNEWSCYRLGEIASITNVLAGEAFEQSAKRVREETVTETTETERIESLERTDEDRTSIELSREVDRAVSSQAHVEGGVNVSGQYGMVKFGASASGGFSSSYEESVRTANKTAHEIVSKAVSRVETRVREERVRTVTTRSVDLTKHVINNVGGQAEHRRGVYRWVDRVDRYQVFHYPERLMLEFQIPEPAQYLRYRISRPAPPQPGGIDQPPAWDVEVEAVTPETVGGLMRTYRATNVPPVPDRTRSVVASKKLSPTPPVNEPPVPDRKEVYNTPAMADVVELTLPKGYGADKAIASAVAMPLRANWRVESTRDISKLDDKKGIEGFHHITMSVAAGNGAPTVVHHPAQGAAPGGWSFFTVQLPSAVFAKDLGSEDRAGKQFGDAVATLKADLTFTSPVTDKVSVAVDVAGASTATFSVEIDCELTGEAYSEWQHSAYDALFASWTNWNEQWRAQSAAAGLGPALSRVDATSPARNRETVVEELKRQVVSWLLSEADFAGRDGMAAAAAGSWPRFDIDKSLGSALQIQFLEQAFEWNNLTYMPYPYYWARSSEWDELNGVDGADATFVQFLRAGSVRVVVPARPAFEAAVLHWLVWQEPFAPGPLPLPGDDLYVSVAQEIFALTQPPEDGEPGATWEATAPTTLLWLDAEADRPPRNEAPRLGLPAGTTASPLCGEPAAPAAQAPDAQVASDLPAFGGSTLTGVPRDR